MMIQIDETEKDLDMKENVLATLLSYMSSEEGSPLNILPGTFFCNNLFMA
jgi:hypothetical protein